MLGSLGLTFDLRERCGKLSVAYQQAIEIVKALSENTRILILDRPTAVLAPPEVERLFAVLRRLKSQGVSIIYISHRLNEIFKIADIVTVIRDGSIAGTANPASSTMDEIISLMIGRRLGGYVPAAPRIHQQQRVSRGGNSLGRPREGRFVLREEGRGAGLCRARGKWKNGNGEGDIRRRPIERGKDLDRWQEDANTISPGCRFCNSHAGPGRPKGPRSAASPRDP